MKILFIFILIITFFISCKSIKNREIIENKEIIQKNNHSGENAENIITLKDRKGYYKSKSPYFTLNINLMENGYADIVLKGWMVYKGLVKVGDPKSEKKKFILDIDNITYIILEFKDTDKAEASIMLKNVVQQKLDMDKTL